MSEVFLQSLTDDLSDLRRNGLYKNERLMTSVQSAQIKIEGQDRAFLNLCSNNYLGLADDPRLFASYVERRIFTASLKSSANIEC